MQEQYQITHGKTLIEVPHNGGPRTFVYESHGPDDYFNVSNSIEKEGLSMPTTAETVSFIHPAFTSAKEEKEFSEIKSIMKNQWLWCSTGILRVPKEGAYIEDNPKVNGKELIMDKSELVKRLEANDSSVRFVPFGFKTGLMTSRELEKNAYIRALAGDEGAEKLADIADKFKSNPYLFSFDSVNRPVKRVSSLDSGWYLDGDGLDVSGDHDGIGRDGCAFGASCAEGAARRAQEIK